MNERKPQYRLRTTGYTTSTLVGCLALSLLMGTVAIIMLPKLVASMQWYAASSAAFVVFVSVIGAGVSIIELLAGEENGR